MTEADEELSARRLGRTVGGRWLLERVLGVGGMATVYAGRGPSGAVAAIKILHPEMSVRREVRERFLREGYVANHIGHAGVVQALEHGDAGDEVFLAMELLAGETLRARVKRHGRLPVAEVLDYADQILDVLAIAHDKGVVHRDLKPDNLFVSPQGRIKILDFGLARVLEGVPAEHRTRTGVALGTLAYMAPEQALGRRAEIDGRVDIFALGATMFRVLSGRRVHEAESEAELLMAMASRPAPPLASVVPGVAPAVSGVVDLALAFSRDARYPDARTMQNDVRALRHGQPGPYASARLSSREEATRADMASATSQRTQPLSATLASHLPGTSSTMPMPMPVMSQGVVTAAPGYAGPVAAQPQFPGALRTAPLAAPPAGAAVGAPIGPASFASTLPSTQPAFGTSQPAFGTSQPAFGTSQSAFATSQPAVATSQPAFASSKGASRGSLAVFLVLGFVGLALASGAGAWYYYGDSSVAASPPVASAATPAASVEPANTAVSPPAEPAPAATGNSGPSPSVRRGPSSTKEAAAAPNASASAGLAASATPSASAAVPAPAAPAAGGTAAPKPDTPAPTPPTVAPTTAPAPATPTAPTAPTSDDDGQRPGSGKRGKGRGR